MRLQSAIEFLFLCFRKRKGTHSIHSNTVPNIFNQLNTFRY